MNTHVPLSDVQEVKLRGVERLLLDATLWDQELVARQITGHRQ